jgi:hypothetical protein
MEIQREMKLATTTGGEPVHADARNAMMANIHEPDSSIAFLGMQAAIALACCGKTIVLYQVTTLEAAEKLMFCIRARL